MGPTRPQGSGRGIRSRRRISSPAQPVRGLSPSRSRTRWNPTGTRPTTKPGRYVTTSPRVCKGAVHDLLYTGLGDRVGRRSFVPGDARVERSSQICMRYQPGFDGTLGSWLIVRTGHVCNTIVLAPFVTGSTESRNYANRDSSSDVLRVLRYDRLSANGRDEGSICM